MSEPEAGGGEDIDAEVVDHTVVPNSYSTTEGGDRKPVDAGKAMGADEKQSASETEQVSTTGSAQASESDWNKVVEEGAFAVHNGTHSIDDLSVPDGVEKTREELINAVTGFLDEHDIQSTEEQSLTKTTRPDNIDWSVAYGKCNVPPAKPQSKTQLQLILDVCDQTPNSSTASQQLIESAVKKGVLVARGRAGFVPREVVN